jgi:hypothetical protein
MDGRRIPFPVRPVKTLAAGENGRRWIRAATGGTNMTRTTVRRLAARSTKELDY